MNFKLKDKPLATQIWVILGLVLGISFLILTILFPLILKSFFTKEMYARIEDSQEYMLQSNGPGSLQENSVPLNNQKSPEDNREKQFKPPSTHPSFRVVRHIYMDENGNIPGTVERELPEDFLTKMKKDVKNQTRVIERYTRNADNKNILYVIRRTGVNDQEGYIISYLWGGYRDDLVKFTFLRIMGTLIFVLIISWIASIFIARYLTKPLRKLQGKVKDIANRKWDSTVKLNRADEIGELGEAVEWMRSQLVEQDKKQQTFLQQVSHELKTPIMVIRSYAQSIYDGIFPRGDLESSIKVIEEETVRLEKKVRSLLNSTKLSYLSTKSLEKIEFDLTRLVKEKVNSFSWRKTELEWELNLDSISIEADKDKLSVVFENLLDNQIRYARSLIKINLNLTEKESGDTYVRLRFWNDGPEIETEVLNNVFQKFSKGSDGEYGLGLAIVKIIVDLHRGRVWAQNEKKGAAFYLEVPVN